MILLIKREDLIKYTSVNALVDSDKFMQYIAIAQDIHIENYLGTALLEKLQADIQGGTLIGNYSMLVSKYIQPMLIHLAMVEYLPFAPYTIANKGVFKHGSENSESVDERGLKLMIDKQKNTADLYVSRFITYMTANKKLFPEYITYLNGKTNASTNQNYFGWVL